MQINIPIDMKKIKEFCTRWQITSLEFFGSVLREDFRPDSDIDVLVTFAPESKWSLLDMAQMHIELEEMFERPVDLVERIIIEESHNPIRRNEILSTAKEIYRAAA
jgi:hypothetical protein